MLFARGNLEAAAGIAHGDHAHRASISFFELPRGSCQRHAFAKQDIHITADLLHAGGDECLWDGDQYFAIGVLADGADGFARASALSQSPSTIAGAPGEASYDSCMEYICDIGFLQGDYWVELQFRGSFATEDAGLDYSTAWTAAVTALAHSVADRVAALPAPKPAWQSPTAMTHTVDEHTGCATDVPTVDLASAVGWTAVEAGLGTHGDVAVASGIRGHAARTQGALTCLWSEIVPDSGQVSLYLVPGSGWSFDTADYPGWADVELAGADSALVDPTGQFFVFVVDSTLVQLNFTGFDALDPIVSGAAEAAVTAAASVLD